MFAKLAHMPRRDEIDDEDLELAERVLRGLAHRYRQDVERQTNPIVREGFEEYAKRCERIAARMARFCLKYASAVRGSNRRASRAVSAPSKAGYTLRALLPHYFERSCALAALLALSLHQLMPPGPPSRVLRRRLCCSRYYFPRKSRTTSFQASGVSKYGE
jgi:hypothetical protein